MTTKVPNKRLGGFDRVIVVLLTRHYITEVSLWLCASVSLTESPADTSKAAATTDSRTETVHEMSIGIQLLTVPNHIEPRVWSLSASVPS